MIIQDWNSSLMSIVSGKTEDHLDMLDNMVIERLLNDKWSTFGRVNLYFYKKNFFVLIISLILG